MQTAIILRGRMAGSRHIELDEPVENMNGCVEITLRSVSNDKESPRRDIADVIATLEGGSRSKEDIDAQIADERDWGDR